MSNPFMQLYVGDYLKDTRHLTAEQHGAYLLLLMSMWTAGGSLPNDPKKLARMAACTTSRWVKIEPEIMEFFTVDGDRIIQTRLKAELEKAQEKSIKRAVSGSKGGSAKALKSHEATVANASGLLQHSSEPEPEKKEEAKASLSPTPTEAPYPEDFLAAWKIYPHHTRRSSKPDSLRQWRKLSPAERLSLPAACARYRRLGAEPKGECGAPAMERWLKRGLHLNWVEDAEPVVAEGPADTAVIARRLRHYRDTGAWEPTWGPRPGIANDPAQNEGKAA